MKNLEIIILLVFTISSLGVVSVYSVHVSPITNGQTIIITANETDTLGLTIDDGGKVIVNSNVTFNLNAGMNLGGINSNVTVLSDANVFITGSVINSGTILIDGFVKVTGLVLNNADIIVRCGILDLLSAPLLGDAQIFIDCNEEGWTPEVHIHDLTLIDAGVDALFIQPNQYLNLTGTLILDNSIADLRGNTTNYGLIEVINGGKIKNGGAITNYCENIDGRGIFLEEGSNIVGGGTITDTVCAIPVVSLVGETPDIEVISGTYNELGATCFSDDEGQIDGKVVIGGDTVDTDNIGIYDVDYDCEDSNVNPVPASTVQRMVAVVDTTMPLVALNGDSVVNIELGVDLYSELDAMCFDLLDGQIDGNVVIGGDSVNDSVANTYVVDYDCDDANSNSATTVQRTVIVADTIAPVITENNPEPITIIEGTVFVPNQYASCSDSFEGDLTSSMNPEVQVDTSNRGIQTQDYGCQDEATNSDNKTIEFIVKKKSVGGSSSSSSSGGLTSSIPQLSDIPTLSFESETIEQTGQSIADLFANLFDNRITEGITTPTPAPSVSTPSPATSDRPNPIADFFQNLFANFFG